MTHLTETTVGFHEHWLNVLAQEVFGDERPDNWILKLAQWVREKNRFVAPPEVVPPQRYNLDAWSYGRLNITAATDGEWVKWSDIRVIQTSAERIVIVNQPSNSYPHHCQVCHVTSHGAANCLNGACGGSVLRYADAQQRLRERHDAAPCDPEEKK